MLHPNTEVRFVNDQIGNGVFATRDIPKGTAVWVQDQLDRLFTEDEVRAMQPACQAILERYCFRDRLGRWVFCWDNTRNINHSFYPTCILTPYQFDIAVTDIVAGQEITNDYGFFNIIEPFECLPEKGCDRTMVMPDDLLRYAEQWDRQLAEAFRFFGTVEQPLAHLIAAKHRTKVDQIVREHVAPDSIRLCFFDQNSQICSQSTDS